MFDSILNQSYLAVKILVTVPVGLLAYVVYYLHREHQRYDHLPGPPRASFFTGYIPTLIKGAKEGVFFAQQLVDLTKVHGSVFRVNFAHRTFVITSDTEMIKEVLVTGNHPKDEGAYKDIYKLFGVRFLGNGLVTLTDQKEWVQKRMHMNPCFQKSYLRNLTHAFNEGGDNLMNHLEKVADGKTKLKMLNEFNHVALDIIANVGFGMELDSIGKENNEFTKSIFTTFHGCAEAIKDPFFRLNPRNWTFCWKVQRALQFLRDSGKKVLTERKAKIAQGDYVPDDILSFLVSMSDKFPETDIEEILDEFLTFFVAGQETSANVMSYIILCLGQHPDVLTRLREEVASAVGDKAVLSFDDLDHMPYMDMVIKETLRLHPPGALTFRNVKNECVMAGHRIPANTTVVAGMYISSHLECNFKDAYKFDPERFNNEGRGVSPYTYFPFAIGPRTCIGKTFAEVNTMIYLPDNAMFIEPEGRGEHYIRGQINHRIYRKQTEMKIIITKFLQKFNFVLDPEQDFGTEFVTTLRPKDKVVCTLTMRDD